MYFATLAGTLVAVSDAGEAPTVVWHSSCGGAAAVFGSPAIVPASGDVVLCCADGTVRCMASSDGAPRWTVVPPGPKGPLFGGATVMGRDHLVVGTHGGTLACLNAMADGATVWHLPVCPTSRLVASPAVDAAPPTWLAHPAQRRMILVTAAASGEMAVVSVPAPGVPGEGDDAGGSDGAGAQAQLPPQVVARASLGGDLFSAPVAHEGVVIVGCRDDCLYGLRLARQRC